jgi:hypothetical protein
MGIKSSLAGRLKPFPKGRKRERDRFHFHLLLCKQVGQVSKNSPLPSFELLSWFSDVDRMSLVTPVLALQAESSLGSGIESA